MWPNLLLQLTIMILKGSIVVEQEGVIGLSTPTYVASRRRGIFTTHLLDRLSLTTPRSQRLPLI